MTRALDINISDTHIGLWQDSAKDATFLRDFLPALIRHLRARGWTVGRDKEIYRLYRTLNPTRRALRKGALRGTLACNGRVIEVDLWAETWEKVNQNGHRYDFDKRQKLEYLDRLRVDLEFAKIVEWARTVATVKSVRDRNREGGARFPDRSYRAALRDRWGSSWHCAEGLGRTLPDPRQAHDRARDGGKILTGAKVWFLDHKGRILRGRAYYDLNNMWMIAAGLWSLKFGVDTGRIFAAQPADLRRKRNERQRRGRLERELAAAIGSMNFRRAETLKRILFGAEELFLIYSRKKDLYYATNSAGYASDRIDAGKYTAIEAAKEVARVPHILHACTLDGRRIDLSHMLERRAA